MYTLISSCSNLLCTHDIPCDFLYTLFAIVAYLSITFWISPYSSTVLLIILNKCSKCSDCIPHCRRIILSIPAYNQPFFILYVINIVSCELIDINQIQFINGVDSKVSQICSPLCVPSFQLVKQNLKSKKQVLHYYCFLLQVIFSSQQKIINVKLLIMFKFYFKLTLSADAIS